MQGGSCCCWFTAGLSLPENTWPSSQPWTDVLLPNVLQEVENHGCVLCRRAVSQQPAGCDTRPPRALQPSLGRASCPRTRETSPSVSETERAALLETLPAAAFPRSRRGSGPPRRISPQAAGRAAAPPPEQRAPRGWRSPDAFCGLPRGDVPALLRGGWEAGPRVTSARISGRWKQSVSTEGSQGENLPHDPSEASSCPAADAAQAAPARLVLWAPLHGSQAELPPWELVLPSLSSAPSARVPFLTVRSVFSHLTSRRRGSQRWGPGGGAEEAFHPLTWVRDAPVGNDLRQEDPEGPDVWFYSERSVVDGFWCGPFNGKLGTWAKRSNGGRELWPERWGTGGEIWGTRKKQTNKQKRKRWSDANLPVCTAGPSQGPRCQGYRLESGSEGIPPPPLASRTFPGRVLVVLDDSGEPKVRDLAHQCGRHQNIGSSQVSVDVVPLLDKSHSFCNLSKGEREKCKEAVWNNTTSPTRLLPGSGEGGTCEGAGRRPGHSQRRDWRRGVGAALVQGIPRRRAQRWGDRPSATRFSPRVRTAPRSGRAPQQAAAGVHGARHNPDPQPRSCEEGVHHPPCAQRRRESRLQVPQPLPEGSRE